MPVSEIQVRNLEQENQRLKSELAFVKNQLSDIISNSFSISSDVFQREKLYDILQAIPIAVSWAGSDDTVEFTNRKFTELFGYSKTDIPTVGDWFQLAYPDPDYHYQIKTKWNAIIDKARHNESGIRPMEVSVTCKDGTEKNVTIKAVIIAECTLAIFDDLTETKKAQNALLESEARFKSVFNGAKDGMLVADSETKTFILANQAIMDMLGYSYEEITSLQVRDIHPQEALDQVISTFERQARKEINMASNLPVKRKNGEVFYADINSGPMIINSRQCLVGIFRDITERKKTEEAILYERDFSDAALNSMPGVFYMFNKSGRFLRWNRNFETVSGYTSVEMQTISPLDLFEGDDKIHIRDKISEAFEKGMAEAEATFVSKNGRKTPYLFTGQLAHVGGIPCLIGMGIDITRQKQAEKMQALGQLAGGIAHDFNNQLSAILGFSQILSSSLDDEKLRKHAEMITHAATRSADLTRQLLAFARKGKYQAEPVDVHIIVAEVISLLSRSIDKRVKIIQNLHAEPSIIMGDSNQIQNALLNLAINSRDAMPDGGELIFHTSVETLDDIFCRKAGFEISPGQYLKISVTDTGKGMDNDVQRHLFEPFFTTKKIGKGTGMGLAAVYGTVKNHKGAICVTSEPGKGSTFCIYIAVADKEAVSAKPTVVINRQHHETALIMVIDDEEIIRMVTSDILKALGHQVMLCRDGQEAIQVYEKNWARINLVILDLMMPGISGIETFTELRNINPSARIILSSGYSIDGQAQSLLKEGAMDFLQKPFTIDQLTTVISNIMNL